MTDSRFWNASGLSVKLGGTGVEVQLELLRALLLGGVAFETPAGPINPPRQARTNHVFPLFTNRGSRQGRLLQAQDPVRRLLPRLGRGPRGRVPMSPCTA